MILEDLEKLNPCKEGLLYAKQFFSLQDAWNNCCRSNWMWWFLSQLNKTTPELYANYSKACIERACNSSQLELNSYMKKVHKLYFYENSNKVASIMGKIITNISAHTIASSSIDIVRENVFNLEYKYQASVLRSLVPNPFNE